MAMAMFCFLLLNSRKARTFPLPLHFCMLGASHHQTTYHMLARIKRHVHHSAKGFQNARYTSTCFPRAWNWVWHGAARLPIHTGIMCSGQSGLGAFWGNTNHAELQSLGGLTQHNGSYHVALVQPHQHHPEPVRSANSRGAQGTIFNILA